MKRRLLSASLVAVIGPMAGAQSPEIIRYDFNNGDATNTASGSIGNGVVGSGLAFPSGLSCGDKGCSTTASNSTIDTQWPLTLGTGDWSVGMHLDVSAVSAGAFMYFFGEPTSFAFRAVTGGGGGIALRANSLNDVDIFGVLSPTPSHVCWVYDSSVPEIRGYLNGVLNNTVAQSPLNINGIANFRVMGQLSSMAPGAVMDDFRFYSRAIDVNGIGPGSEMHLWVNGCASTGDCPGSAVQYGHGCPGTGNFVPAIALTGCPEENGQVALEISNGLGGSSAILLFGLGQGSTPIGVSGCSLLVAPLIGPPLTVPLTPGGPGQGIFFLPGLIPPGTAGASFTMQAWVIDPVSPAGAAATNGVQVTIG